MSEHSPKPWRDASPDEGRIQDAGGFTVATVVCLRDIPLIAAAPDMKSALEEISELDFGLAGNIARAALAKAEGKS